MSIRSAWPASIITPAGMCPWCRYQESHVTSVSVQIVPFPMLAGSAARPTTRSARRSGGSGIRTWRS